MMSSTNWVLNLTGPTDSNEFNRRTRRAFAKFCDEKKISEVNDQNVYDVLNRFVEWNDARRIRSKTIVDYFSGTMRNRRAVFASGHRASPR
jgi:hypothetical protein